MVSLRTETPKAPSSSGASSGEGEKVGISALQITPLFLWFVIWILIGVVVGLIAASRGRSFIGWGIYALLIWPVALVHLVCIPRTERGLERRARADGRSRCPHCSEHVRHEAKVCPYCRKKVGPAERRWDDHIVRRPAGGERPTARGLPGYPGNRD